jgi:putative transposase
MCETPKNPVNAPTRGADRTTLVIARPKPNKFGAPAPRRPASCPPYNPGLQQLVDGKQAWAEPLDHAAKTRGFLGWHQRGYLPHRDAPGLTQFVTCRLHDSFPLSRRAEWEALLRIEDNRQRRIQLEDYLDRGHGACWLRRPEMAALAEGALRESDGQDYDLLAWAIMPNHVHVLVRIRDTPMAVLIKNWKGRIAREANKLLRRPGPFWEREYWDTYMRAEEQLVRARRYIEQNPVKARLVCQAKDWPWSSARLRDAYGKLPLSPGPVSRLQVGAPPRYREVNSLAAGNTCGRSWPGR